jgi:hypothetical protein
MRETMMDAETRAEGERLARRCRWAESNYRGHRDASTLQYIRQDDPVETERCQRLIDEIEADVLRDYARPGESAEDAILRENDEAPAAFAAWLAEHGPIAVDGLAWTLRNGHPWHERAR